MSLATEAFEVLREDLAGIRPDVAERDCILCPICLREIPRAKVELQGVEHIIPQSVVEKDPEDVRKLGTKNQRAGITVLCREPRTITSTGAVAPHGCNGFKGSTYDWPLRFVLDQKPHDPSKLKHRHGVAILVMAYLGAFQHFGYSYVLRPELDEIRKQFDYPDEPVTTWLEHAQYRTVPAATQIVRTATGQPFVFGGVLNDTSPLGIAFRRCRALLPHGHWESRGVASLETLLRGE